VDSHRYERTTKHLRSQTPTVKSCLNSTTVLLSIQWTAKTNNGRPCTSALAGWPTCTVSLAAPTLLPVVTAHNTTISDFPSYKPIYIWSLTVPAHVFSPEDGDSTLLRNVGFYQPIHAATEPKTTSSELT
jgi:hypothetical protein